MRQVSQAFLEAMVAPERQVTARVTIDYTDPKIDQSIEVSASDQGAISYPEQTADAVQDPPYKWASLDGSWVLDGTYHLIPDTPEDAARYQVGWWGATLAGAGGAFSAPYPALTVTFLSRPVHSLRVVGDSARGEYPVDFVIRLYNEGALLHEEVVTGNTEVAWARPLEEPITSVTRMELEIRRWSHEGRVVKILEFFTSVQQTYLAGDILEISLIEEREVLQNTLPVGSISANEIKIRLSNEDRRFDADNAQSPLYELLKPHRRIRAWLAAVLPDGTEEYVPLGLFWSTEWQAEDDTVEASVVARDRLELLRKSTYQSSQVLQNQSLYDLAVLVLADAGLDPEEYWVDPALQSITVPYAWFEPVSHREALRRIAEAGLAQVYSDRDGILRVECQDAGNAIFNPSMTVDSNGDGLADGWNRWGANTVLSVTADGQRVQGSGGASCGVVQRNRLPVKQGDTVYISFEVRQGSAGATFLPNYLYVMYDVPGNVGMGSRGADLSYYTDLGGGWLRFDYAWTANKDGTIGLLLGGYPPAGQMYDAIFRNAYLSHQPRVALDITPDEYYRLANPMRPNQVANEVIVSTSPLRPADVPEQVYRSNEPIQVPAGKAVTVTVYYQKTPVIDAIASLDGAPAGVAITQATYYGWGAEVTIQNTGGTDADVILVVIGRPLSVQNRERAVARDEASIIENGVLRYEFPALPLVQSLAVAQEIADRVLASAKDARRDLEIDWRGNPSLELGDVVRVKGRNYAVIRQEIRWVGALSAYTTGRRVS